MKNYFAIFILTTAITSNSYTSFCRSAPIMQYLTEQRQLELEEARAMLLRELQATAQASAAPVQPTLTPQQQAAQEQQRQAAIAQKQAALVQAQAKRQAAKVLAQQQAAAVQARHRAADGIRGGQQVRRPGRAA